MQFYTPANDEEFKTVQEARHTSNEHEYPLSPWHEEIMNDFSEYLVAPVLDVGCRNGLFVETLNKKGIEAAGIEITDIADYAIGLGRNVIKGDIQKKTDFEDGYFKTVVASHVIEHCYDPENAVKEIRRILDGYLIMYYPFCCGTKEYLTNFGHYVGIESDQEIIDFLEKNGFEIVKLIDGGQWSRGLIAKTK
jgi:SAM-dependent methyltransferase